MRTLCQGTVRYSPGTDPPNPRWFSSKSGLEDSDWTVVRGRRRRSGQDDGGSGQDDDGSGEDEGSQGNTTMGQGKMTAVRGR